MALEKVFSIKIDGVIQSIKDVTSLADALERLQKSAEQQVTTQTKLTQEEKASAKAAQEAANIRAKAAQLASEEGKEMLKLKQSISEITKETKLQVQAEKDRATLAANDLSSYNAKQQVLSALGRTIKNYVATTEDEKKELESLKQRYLELNTELQNFDTEMGNNQRRVGSYIQAAEPLKTQLREIQQQLQQMMVEGVDPSSEAFQTLVKEAGRLKDIQGDVEAMTRSLASDTHAIDQVVGGFKDAVAITTLWKSTMSGLGFETEAFEETLTKLQALQASLNALQTIQNDLQNQSTLLFKAKTAVVNLFTKAEAGATVATKAFSAALKSIGIGLIIAAVAALVEYFDDIKEWIGETIGGTEKLEKGWEKVMSALKGVGNCVLQYVIQPFKTAVAVGQKLIDLDFKGAMDELANGVKKQFNVVENFNSMYNKSQAKYAEERTRKQAAENAKQLKQQIDHDDAMYGSDQKYTSKGKKLWSDYYKSLIASTKEGSDERIKAENDYLKFQRDMAKKEEELKKQQLERARKYNEEFNKAWESYQSETQKMSDDNVKKLLDNDKKVLDAGKADTEQALKERKAQWKVYYASLDTIQEEEAEKEKSNAEKQFGELIQAAKNAGKNVEKLQNDLADRLFEIDQKLAQALEDNQRDLEKALEKDQKDLIKSQIENVTKMVDEGQASLKSRLETLQGTNLKNPTISMLKDIKEAYNDYLVDLEMEHTKFVALIQEEMDKLNPDSEEYKKLVDKKEKVDKEYLNSKKSITAKIADLDKQATDKVLADVETYKSAVESIMSSINDIMSVTSDRLSDKLDAVSKKYDAITEKVETGQERIKELNDQLAESTGAQRLALQQELEEETKANDERKAQQQKLAAEEKKLKQAQADNEYKSKKAELTANLVLAVANTALAITKAVSQSPMTGGLPGSAIATATGAVQIALISKQLSALKPVKFENGGYLSGPRHSQGGMRVGNTNVEVEGGEFVVNRRATAHYRDLLERLNSYGNNGIQRPNHYANGGELSIPNNTNQMVLDAINRININPVVSVVDINRVQGNLTRVQSYARG